jgi:cytoskeletal protein CcmA (bactofilin family)
LLKQRTEVSDKVTTIIGPGTRVEGTLEAKGIIRVDGVVQGKMITPSEIIIGEEGKVEADVEAGNLVIAGVMTGNAEVRGRLEIKQGGTLRGDLHADKVIMEEGASFDGRCTMKRESSPAGKKEKA